MSEMNDRVLATLVGAHLDAAESVRRLLSKRGPKIVAALMKRMSLREVARRTELSPTYLSRVLNRTATISPAAFLKLVEITES